MKKLIFCNLDLLKSNLDPTDYQELDLSNFNLERMRKKRDNLRKSSNSFQKIQIIPSTSTAEKLMF